MHYPVPALSQAELSEGLRELLQRERTSVVDTIEWLIYVNRYKHFIQEGYYSLYDYLQRGFGMSANQAFKRHTVVRQVDFFPELMGHLRSGALSLSHIVVLSGHLTEANYDVIIPLVLRQSVTETRRVVSEIGLDGAPTGVEPGYLLQLQISEEMRGRLLRVRALLNGKGESASFERAIDAALIGWLRKNDPFLRAQQALIKREKQQLGSELKQRHDPRPHLFEDIAGPEEPEGTKAQATTESSADFRPQPGAPLEQQGSGEPPIFEETPRHHAKEAESKKNRTIPALLRHQVMVRDHGQCTYESPHGVRCEARVHLAFDHKVPWSRGGTHSAANLRILCFTHNMLAARQLLGRDVMDHFSTA